MLSFLRVMNLVSTLVLNLFTLIFFFAIGPVIFFEVQCFFIVKRKANSTIALQNCKGHKKRDRLLISKMEIDHQIF